VKDESSMRIEQRLAVTMLPGATDPVARYHFTTVDTAAPNRDATKRLLSLKTAATTRSLDGGLLIGCWPAAPASILNHKSS
jgi:hypothetical protein